MGSCVLGRHVHSAVSHGLAQGSPRPRSWPAPHTAPFFTIHAVFMPNPSSVDARILPGVSRASGAPRCHAARWAAPPAVRLCTRGVRARRSHLHDTLFKLYPHPRVTHDCRCSHGDSAVLMCERKPYLTCDIPRVSLNLLCMRRTGFDLSL